MIAPGVPVAMVTDGMRAGYSFGGPFGVNTGVFTVPSESVVPEPGLAAPVFAKISFARTAKKYVIRGARPVALKDVAVVVKTLLVPLPNGLLQSANV